MKLGKKLLALSTFALVIGLTSCGDPNYPRTFEVDFETGATGVEIASQTVKEGYKLQLTNDILNPTNSAEHYLFRGWYEDSEYTKAFDVETYRVMDNMTLYAKWTFPTDTPSEFSIGEDAFSKTVTWVQTGVEKESDISIEVIKADKVENLIYDDRLDQWILDPVNPYKFEYDETKKESVTGQVTIDKANYKVSFERDASYGGSKYKFFIYNKGELVKEETDIQFKGSGTQDDPYYVYNTNDLKYLTTNDIPEGTYVELKSSITLKSLYSEKRGKVFNGNFKPLVGKYSDFHTYLPDFIGISMYNAVCNSFGNRSFNIPQFFHCGIKLRCKGCRSRSGECFVTALAGKFQLYVIFHFYHF